MPIKTQSALINPYTLPAPQNAAEEEFAKCMAAGIPYRIGNGRPKQPINKGCRTTPEDRETDNVIRASVIKFFAWGGDEDNLMRGDVIDLQGVWVTGALDLTGASIPYALIFTNCHFEQCVVLSYSALRRLELYGARLVCGLAGKSMRVHDDILMNGPFLSEGEISFLDASIGGNLYCEGKMENKGGYAFAADRIKVGGNLSFGGGFYAEGMVRLPAANIGKDLYCDNAEFNGEFNIKAATIKNRLFFQDIKGSGTVNLSFASVDILADEGEAWEKFHLNLDGFSYARFADEPADVEARINWLKKWPEWPEWPERPGGKVEFSTQPFEQAARALFAVGRDKDARKILLEKEQLLTKKGAFPPLHKWWRNILGWVAGYGYQLGKTLALSVAIILVWGAMFFAADRMGHIVPSQPAVMAHINKQELVEEKCSGITRPTEVAVCLFPEYPRFHPWSYSLDAFIPFFFVKSRILLASATRKGGQLCCPLVLCVLVWA